MPTRIYKGTGGEKIRPHGEGPEDTAAKLRELAKKSEAIRDKAKLKEVQTAIGDIEKTLEENAEVSARETEKKTSEKHEPPPNGDENGEDTEEIAAVKEEALRRRKHTLADEMGPRLNLREKLDAKLRDKDSKFARWLRRLIWAVPSPRRLLKYLIPDVWKAFWAKWKEPYEISLERAMGQAEEESVALRTRGKLLLPYEYRRERTHIMKFLEEYSYLSKEKQMHAAVLIADWDAAEGRDRRKALLVLAASNGYIDDLMGQKFFMKRLQKLGKEKYGYQNGEWYNEILIREFLCDFLTGRALSNPGTGADHVTEVEKHLIEDLEEQGRKVNHWEYLGYTQVDEATGEHYVSRIGLLYDGDGYAIDEDGERVTIDGQAVKAWEEDKEAIDGGYFDMEYDKRQKKWKIKLADGTYAYKTGEEIYKSGALWYNREQTLFAVGEFKKKGERAGAGAAPHNFTTLGGRKEGKAADMSVFNREYIKSAKGATSRATEEQTRIIDWLFGNAQIDVIGTSGEISIVDPVMYRKLVSLAKVNPAQIKVGFAKYAGIYNALLVKKVTIRYKGPMVQLIAQFPKFTSDEVEGKVAFMIPDGPVKPGMARFKDGATVGNPAESYLRQQSLVKALLGDFARKPEYQTDDIEVWKKKYAELFTTDAGKAVQQEVDISFNQAQEEREEQEGGADFSPDEEAEVRARAFRDMVREARSGG